MENENKDIITNEEVEENKDQLEDIEEGIVGALIVEPEDPNPPQVDGIIIGDTFIKPRKEYVFTYKGNLIADWRVGDDAPVSLEADGKEVKLRWTTSYSG